MTVIIKTGILPPLFFHFFPFLSEKDLKLYIHIEHLRKENKLYDND